MEWATKSQTCQKNMKKTKGRSRLGQVLWFFASPPWHQNLPLNSIYQSYPNQPTCDLQNHYVSELFTNLPALSFFGNVVDSIINPKVYNGLYMEASYNGGTPKSSILKGFFLINHPFGGTSIFGNPIWHWLSTFTTTARMAQARLAGPGFAMGS